MRTYMQATCDTLSLITMKQRLSLSLITVLLLCQLSVSQFNEWPSEMETCRWTSQWILSRKQQLSSCWNTQGVQRWARNHLVLRREVSGDKSAWNFLSKSFSRSDHERTRCTSVQQRLLIENRQILGKTDFQTLVSSWALKANLTTKGRISAT